MSKEIQNKLWSNLPDYMKEHYRSRYWNFKNQCTLDGEAIACELSYIFGKDNLIYNFIPKIWEEVANYDSDVYYEIGEDLVNSMIYDSLPEPILNQIIATAKIAKLIELGYGGLVTSRARLDSNITKYFIGIALDRNELIQDSATFNVQTLLCFHTEEQMIEFMSHPENIELAKQYYMI